MCLRQPSTLLSHDRDVSEIHFCFQGLLHAQYFPKLGYDTSPLCPVRSSLDDLAFMSHDLATPGNVFLPFSTPCNGRTCVFRTFRFATPAMFAVPPNSCRTVLFCVNAPIMTQDHACAACLAVSRILHASSKYFDVFWARIFLTGHSAITHSQDLPALGRCFQGPSSHKRLLLLGPSDFFLSTT